MTLHCSGQLKALKEPNDSVISLTLVDYHYTKSLEAAVQLKTQEVHNDTPMLPQVFFAQVSFKKRSGCYKKF